MNASEPIRFGVYEVDLSRRELRKHGIRIKLQSQPFELLVALLEKPGELLARDELRVRIWGEDTFVEFDQSLNRAVNKLRDALGDSAENPRFIETVPRRGYRFIAPLALPERPASPSSSVVVTATEQSLPPLATSLPPNSRMHRAIAGGLVVALSFAGYLWIARRSDHRPSKVVALTTFTGEETHVSFSPDGRAVVFMWVGEKRDNQDIYIKNVGQPTTLRVTSDPAPEGYPSWSPDGKQIAFIRFRAGGGLFVVSPLGGEARKIASIWSNSRPSWSADARYLLAASVYSEEQPRNGAGALFRVPADGTSEARQILAPPAGSWFVEPAYSPNGRELAFAVCSGSLSRPSCGLQIVGLTKNSELAGAPRQITARNYVPQGLAWSRDGGSLIYGGGGTGPGFLWRVAADGKNAPERLDIAGAGASYPDVDRATGRLAFTRSMDNSDIWQVGTDAGPPVPLLTSTTRDCSPQYSPDGRHIAFESGRGGDRIAIWIANADGSGAAELTRVESEQCGSPRWSPDGGSLAFDCFESGGGWNIWKSDANGSSLKRMTASGADHIAPSWSHDGRSVYYGSKQTGRFEIWRVPANGGDAVQVTRNGGYTAFESVEGGTLFYSVSEFGSEGLFSKVLPDGDEVPLTRERVARRGFVVFPDGIYYLTGSGNHYQVRFHEFAAARRQTVAEFEGPLQLGLAVNPERKSFLFSKVVFSGSDLMLIENLQ